MKREHFFTGEKLDDVWMKIEPSYTIKVIDKDDFIRYEGLNCKMPVCLMANKIANVNYTGSRCAEIKLL